MGRQDMGASVDRFKIRDLSQKYRNWVESHAFDHEESKYDIYFALRPREPFPQRTWSCQKLNKSRKNNFRNVMIFISYPMYFDPIRTMVKWKNRIYFIEGVFWLQNVSGSANFAKVRDLDGFGPKPPIQRKKIDFFTSPLFLSGRNT